MKTSKLEQTIGVLSAKERRLFSDFLQSPLFNRREDVQKLYAWLQQGKPVEPRETLSTWLWPGAAFDAQRLHLTMSYLQGLAGQFLALQYWREQPAATDIALVQALRQRGPDRHFEEALRQAKSTVLRHPGRNLTYFNNIGQLMWEEARFEQQRNTTEVKYLKQLSENADLAWLTQKLRLLCLHRTQGILYRSDEVLVFEAEMEAVLQRHDLEQAPAVRVWYFCLKMLEEPENPEYFIQFKRALLEEDQRFDAEEIRDLYLYALNYCIRQVNAGNKVFFHDIMDFYKNGLLKRYLLENGVLSRFTYHNIVAAGLQTQEFEWVEDFINRYKNTLERSYRESSYSFNMARLEFMRKRYGEALSLLQHSNYHDPLLNLAAKTISLKIYYELGEYDLLNAHLEAMKNYIRRKTVLGYHRNNYLNLVRYTQKLINANRFDPVALATLREQISAEPVLTEREWLMEQVNREGELPVRPQGSGL